MLCMSYFQTSCGYIMSSTSNSSRDWKILCWNVRGINSDKKWDSIRDKIVESRCDIVCLQETKREIFDISFIRKFCPASFDAFEYLPSVGASSGIITIWKSALFDGHLCFQNEFAISVDFTSKHNNADWMLTNIYGPCTRDGKELFTDWLKNIDMPDDIDWLVVGDFNLKTETSQEGMLRKCSGSMKLLAL